MRYLIVAAALLGCGGEDESQITCEPSDRNGTYWAEFETKSGNCGDQAAGLIRIQSEPGEPGGGGDCTLTSFTASDGDCKVEATTVCAADNIAPGVTIESIAVTEQQDSEGDVIDGTMTLHIIDANGQTLCYGAYDLHAVRQ